LRFFVSDISARMSISQILLPLTFEFKAGGFKDEVQQG
jgi:hypothetical protein